MRNFLVFGLTVALTVTAATPNVAFAAPAGGFTDTDSDGINDAVESPACVGDAGESRGGVTDSRGGTGTFRACFEARPDSWYSCGSPESWDRVGLEPTPDENDYGGPRPPPRPSRRTDALNPQPPSPPPGPPRAPGAGGRRRAPRGRGPRPPPGPPRRGAYRAPPPRGHRTT